MKIYFQGVSGAYSEAAALKAHPDCESVGCKTFIEVFQKVNISDYGMIPIENSISGSILENYDNLLKNDHTIIGEVFLRIEHCLIGVPAAKIDEIKVVYSHPHAIEQCRKYLEEENIKIIPEFDTSGSVTLVKDINSVNVAAIASELAAQKNDMTVLKKGIETNKENYTRFFLISKSPNKEVKKEKTSIVFSTGHYAGALADCLNRLAKQNISLTKLESRPVLGKPWEYIFYVDFLGSDEEDYVSEALKELSVICKYFKVLGSYPKGEK